MKKLISTQLILLFFNPLWAQTPGNLVNTPKIDGKTVISVSVRQTPAFQTLPLDYNINTIRMLATLPNPMNKERATLLPYDTGQRWSSTFGTHNHYDGVLDLLEDYDKGYCLLGYDYTSNTNGEGWILKTDINGELLWDKKLINPQWAYIGWCGFIDSTENKYVAGVAFLDKPWPFLVKINACGEKEWCTLYKDLDYINGGPFDILINNEGNIVVLTRFEDAGPQTNQIYLLCYSPDGDFLWAKPYASKSDYPLIALAVGNKFSHFGEGYIISGYCYYPYPDDPNQYHVWLHPMFIGIDSQFNEKWMLPFGVSDSVVGMAYSAIPLNDSVIMGVGYKGLDYPNSDIRSSLMMFINNEGEELGYKRIWGDSIAPGTQENVLAEIEPINDTLFMATAVFGPLATGNPFGEMVIDTSGKVYNTLSHPNTTGAIPLIRKTFDDKYMVAMNLYEADMNHTDIVLYKLNANLEQDTLYTQPFVYDSLCPDPIVSGDIDMTNCSVVQVGIDEAPTPEEYYKSLNTIPVKAWPNPAEDWISFEYKNTDRHQLIRLDCYDITGQKIHTEAIATGQLGSKINISSWGSGVYMAIISSGGRIVGKGKFVVK
jgi:hypothetical protein